MLIEATPRDATGAQRTVRLAGGGRRGYTHLGHNDWRAGIVTEPRFTAELGFDEGGWTKGGVAKAADLVFTSASAGLASDLAGLMWLDAPITISAGEETGAFSTRLAGTVAQQTFASGALTLSPTDFSIALAKSVAPDTFAGTGGLEGSSDATGRVKRRSFGRVFNVEGLVFDAASNVYEFGDPARPLAGIVSVRDKGRSGPMNILGWQGTAQITLDVLKAATPPAGGAIIAPSIACVKWWTAPAGPLTADIEGEIGAGYAETVADLAAALVTGSGVAIADVAAAAALRPAPAGIHIGTATETISDALDRLLLNVSLLWVLDATGSIQINEWTWSAPIETLASSRVARDALYRPVGTRTVGYQKNERIQSDGEIAADVDDMASDAASDATAALARIAVIDSDGWLSAGEKPDVIRIVTTFDDEAPVLAAQAGRLAIVTELDTLQAAKLALDTYLTSLSPAWNDTNHDTAIDAATFQGRFTDYEYARTLLVSAIADEAATRASWDKITGTEVVTQPIDINAAAIISQGLRQDDAQIVLDARTLVSGQPVSTEFQTFRNDQTTTNSAVASSLALIGAKTADATAWNLNLDTVQIGAGTTLAQKFAEIGANNGAVAATVESLQEIVLGPGGSAAARAVLKVDVNGNIAGVYLSSSNTEKSSIGLVAGVTDICAADGTVLAQFEQDADGAYIPNLKVDTLKVGTVVTSSVAAGQVTGLMTYSFPDVQITSVETTIAEITGIVIGDAVDGKAVALVDFTQDGTSNVDTAMQVRAYVDLGAGYTLVKSRLSGIVVGSGSAHWSLPLAFTVPILGSGPASLKITGQASEIDSSGHGNTSSSYARSTQIDIFSGSR